MRTVPRLLVLAIIAGVGLVILGSLSVAGWEYSNSNHFCTNACHDVHPETPYAHRASQHLEVKCVECHVGRVSLWETAWRKILHSGHVWGMVAGYERPLTSWSMPPSRESCETCHSGQPHPHDSIRTRTHFAADADNTRTEFGLILRTAGAPLQGEGSQGIHWHVENPVRYISTDPLHEQIPWVEVTRPDGSVTTYVDPAAEPSAADVAAAEKRVMDCVDCHNRSGHPFRPPEEAVDEALAAGELDPDLPYVKARVVDVLEQEFDTPAEARRQVEAAWEQYRRDFPNLPEEYPEAWAEAKHFIEERIDLITELKVRSKFLAPEVSWMSFPDHRAHEYSPGCFRCHSGRHRDAEGTPLRVGCTLCHSVPVVIRDGDLPMHFATTLSLPRPPSHADPQWVAIHGMSVDETCEACHGEIEYGTDDQSFCANSGCHDRSWPGLSIDALRASAR